MPCRVIIVEDHVDSAEGLAALLAIWGHEPHIAGDGERALELIETLSPDVVLTDIGLPGIDGHELARRIRSMAAGGDILLLAITGTAEDGDFGASGFDCRLTKPVDFGALERLLQARTRG